MGLYRFRWLWINLHYRFSAIVEKGEKMNFVLREIKGKHLYTRCMNGFSNNLTCFINTQIAIAF